MPNWKKLIVSGSDASLNSLNVTNNVTAQSFTGSFSGSFTAPGATTQVVYNNGGVLAANSGFVYSGSNVGIGISSPTEKLHIVSSAAGNQFARITATDSNASAAWVAQNDSGDNVVYRVFSSGVSGTQMGAALGRSASLLANLGGSGVFLLGTFSNTNFVLGTNNTENMRITTAGNVGIGTTSPVTGLDVRTSPYSNTTARFGTARPVYIINDDPIIGFNQYYNSGWKAGTTGYSGNIGVSSAGEMYFNVSTTSVVTDNLVTQREVMRILNNGNVGIGTASPDMLLSVRGTDSTAVSSTTFYNFSFKGAELSNLSNTVNTVTGLALTGGSNRTSISAIGNVLESASLGALAFFTGGSGLSNTVPERMRITSGGNVGIGTTSPGYKLEVVGAVSASTYYGDGSNLTGIGSGSVAAAGSDGQLQYNNSGLFGGATRLIYNDTTNRVGIGTSSPGYDLDVSGSVRVQDRLRVGPINTGNGVIHQSSDATINPLSSTIVWSVPGSAGICAFIEYYIFNSTTGTSQRAGNIVTTWNSAGTPQITHTETTTPDIGTTALVTFTTSITLGGDPQLVATNTSINPFYIVLNYRYF